MTWWAFGSTFFSGQFAGVLHSRFIGSHEFKTPTNWGTPCAIAERVRTRLMAKPARNSSQPQEFQLSKFEI
jgi:hypothetical protein